MTKIGVLSLQGDFKEHIEMLDKCSVKTISVKLPSDLDEVAGLIIPGGESTAIGNLMQKNNLIDEIIEKHRKGMALFGTCAGAILLSKDITGYELPSLRLLDTSIVRNSYGRQINSFEADLDIDKIGKFKGVFIRAPVIEKVNGARVLSKLDDKPVLIRQNNILAATFHPELTDDKRIHEYFVGMVRE